MCHISLLIFLFFDEPAGSIGISRDTFQKLVEELVKSLKNIGFRKIVSLCGHDEAFEISKRIKGIESYTWWDLGWPVFGKFLKSRYENLGRGGEDENSLLLYFKLTKKRNKADCRKLPCRSMSSRKTIIGYPEFSDRRKGKIIFEAVVEELTKICKSALEKKT